MIGHNATVVAELLGISRETLYVDRRQAWEALTPAPQTASAAPTTRVVGF